MIEPCVIQLRSVDTERLRIGSWSNYNGPEENRGVIYPVQNRRYATHNIDDTKVYTDKCELIKAFYRQDCNEYWTKHIVPLKGVKIA